MRTLDWWRGQKPNEMYSVMDKMLDEFRGWPETWTPTWSGKDIARFNPRSEVSETKTHYNFKFDLPGLTKDQIKVELLDNRLTVSGERREEKKEEDKERKTHFSEVFYGSFTRSFDFPTSVDAEKVDAKYDNGVLTLAVPKTMSSSAKQIGIK